MSDALLDISDEWDALFVSKLFILFSTSVSDTVWKEKLKLHFSRINLRLRWFWYLDILAKTLFPFSGFWQSNLFGNLFGLVNKLATKFSKY